jgi:hypothetical protein
MSALQITKADFTARHACVFGHLIPFSIFKGVVEFNFDMATKRRKKHRNKIPPVPLNSEELFNRDEPHFIGTIKRS